MTDWLEVARRELRAADKNKVSSVSAVCEVGAFDKLEAFRLRRQTVVAEEIPFNDPDDALALNADDKTMARTTPPAKIAETPVSTIMAVRDNGSVNQSLPDDHAEIGANVASPQTTKPSNIQNGPGEELPKLTKSLASDERDRALDGPTADARHWRRKFEDSTILVQRVRNLPQAEAKRAAYDIVLVEFLNATHPDTDPNRCDWCGQPEAPSNILLPFGVSTHVWLHDLCWTPWREGRRAEAIAVLAEAGVP